MGSRDGAPGPVNRSPLRSQTIDTAHLCPECRLPLESPTAADDRLQQATDALVAEQQRRSEFLAMLAHELRAPLQATLGRVQRLRATSGGDPAIHLARGLDTIERNTLRQARLLDDLAHLATLWVGKFRLARTSIDLVTLVGGVIESFVPAAAAKGIRLDGEVSRRPAMVKADVDAVTQVVTNLLSNAVAFTPSGGTVVVRIQRRSADVRLVVSDTGAGITDEALPHIFDRFWQSHARRSAQHGLGLGLAIVRQLVELHGGTVEAKSAGGAGARFLVTLPLTADTGLALVRRTFPDGVVPRSPSVLVRALREYAAGTWTPPRDATSPATVAVTAMAVRLPSTRARTGVSET